MAECLLTLAMLPLSSTLALTATAKLADFDRWRVALHEYRIEVLRRPWVAFAVPVAELTTAFVLVLGPLRLACWLAAAVFGTMTVLLVLATLAGASGDCGCFGPLLSVQLGRGSIVRALVLFAWAGVLVLLPEPTIVGSTAHWVRLAPTVVAGFVPLAWLGRDRLRRLHTAQLS